ncbi:hypothetical protein [Rhizobium bangladeshense]|uniref:hypothetical protein n=1 Tax=Rhizobium bangladeshense TaxID=1138189 RepID=UPI001C9129FE|nr:hypothetical protein [Rhizobium bangladeshense]MBY3598869.1 hypothetical protein [Rhizobium bangladeshense]
MKTAIMLTAVCVLIPSEAVFAQSKKTCDGNAKQIHVFSGYNFLTTSSVFHRWNSEIYQTCVENHSGRWLAINWKTPGPWSFIPDNHALESNRPFDTRETLNLKGCLEYGNMADGLSEPFLGHKDDEPLVAAEKCNFVDGEATSAPTTKIASSASIPDISFEVYVPSDIRNPEATMLHIDGKVSLENTENEYISEVKFAATRYNEESKGNPEDLELKPYGAGLSYGAVQASYARSYKYPIMLSGKNEISITFSKTPKSRIVPGQYGFWDKKNGVFVGAFSFPAVSTP